MSCSESFVLTESASDRHLLLSPLHASLTRDVGNRANQTFLSIICEQRRRTSFDESWTWRVLTPFARNSTVSESFPTVDRVHEMPLPAFKLLSCINVNHVQAMPGPEGRARGLYNENRLVSMANTVLLATKLSLTYHLLAQFGPIWDGRNIAYLFLASSKTETQ